MSKFDQQIDTSRAVPLIPYREMTPADMLTDVGWLDGDSKEHMKGYFLQKYGQYFDKGIRQTI